MTTRRDIMAFLGALPILSLVGCGNSDTAGNCQPIVLSDNRACALCGMTISTFPGPKGQACVDDGRTLGFCSTSDLLSWAWQPDSKPRIGRLYVHDLSQTQWSSPSDDAWIEARDAVYVIGHDRKSAMGHSPAPFSDRADAERFASESGGRLRSFPDLDWDALKARS